MHKTLHVICTLLLRCVFAWISAVSAFHATSPFAIDRRDFPLSGLSHAHDHVQHPSITARGRQDASSKTHPNFVAAPGNTDSSNQRADHQVQDVRFSASNPVSRGEAVALVLPGVAAALTAAAAPSYAVDPVKKAQEAYRIWRQEEADNLLGGDELASPEGGKTLQPVLALIPIVT